MQEGAISAAANELSAGCVVCGPGHSHAMHIVPEAMFQSGEQFRYRECGSCGCLQISDMPDDLSPYYGTNYYSFGKPTGRLSHDVLQTRLARDVVRLNTRFYNRFGYGRGIPWARSARMAIDDRIIDVGCGAGENLLRMRAYGYRHLTGADPFLDADRVVAPEVQLVRRSHTDITGEFDWIMMHHAFEHVPDPRATLASFKRILARDGRVLLRVPLVGGLAWREYGTDWVQIDAPRHLVLYSLRGLRRLVEQEGFEVELVVYDSSGFQFWASEKVRRRESYLHGPLGFTDEQLATWEQRSKDVNKALDGDQAAIVIRMAH
jgi:SAM-dependent methyltransferase